MIYLRTFRPFVIQPLTVHPDFLTSPYVSSLKEPGCSKHPFPDRYIPEHFIPNGKVYFKLLFPDFLCGKDQKYLMKTHTQQNSTNPWVSRPCALT
jgi:hypothetical protein